MFSLNSTVRTSLFILLTFATVDVHAESAGSKSSTPAVAAPGNGVIAWDAVESAPPEMGVEPGSPAEIPDPLTVDPAAHNPGGVNGDRPPRKSNL